MALSMKLLILLLVSLAQVSYSRFLTQDPNSIIAYHNGAILKDDIPLTLVWCGDFTQDDMSIITGFLGSLTPNGISTNPQSSGSVTSVAQWWSKISQDYVGEASNNARTNVFIDKQVTEKKCSSGQVLTLTQITQIAVKSKPKKGGIALVFTAADVLVEGFGMTRCGSHSYDEQTGAAVVWVGNPKTQCLGHCAWPLAKPVYGPQTEPLKSPNRNVPIDGMVATMGTLLPGTVTNPKGDGYYRGDIKLEVGTACSGVFGPGAYPGYPGKVLNDSSSGGNYNVQGNDGKKYLVPGMYDRKKASCYNFA